MKITPMAKATIYSVFIEKITGEKPILQDKGNYVNIVLSNSQEKTMQALLENKIDSKQESDVRVDLKPVLSPIIIKKALPIGIGILVGGYILGKIL